MPGISLDFGLLIAYFIPGMLILLGVAYIFKDVSAVMSKYRSGEASAGYLLTISALAVVIGMAVSVVRASTIDKSFAWALPMGGNHYRGLPEVSPDYAQLTDQGKLSAFREAEENDKRPYQFYGNTLLASIIFIAGWWRSVYIRNRTQLLKHCMLALIGIILTTVIFYPACRKSYYRYNGAVSAINNHQRT